MPKLPQGVNRRKDGLLEKRFTIDGKRVSVYAHTVKELQEKELAKRQEIQQHGYRKNSEVTLDEYYLEWIREKSRHVKPSTINQHEILYHVHISKYLGKEKVQKIEKREIINLTERIKETSGPKRANDALKEIKSILSSALKDDIITRNPADSIRQFAKGREMTAAETIHRALSREEQAAFLEAIKEEYQREMFELLLSTGMRFGECAALTWGDIDYKAGVIHVTKTLTREVNGKIVVSDTTKTKTSYRDIPINTTIQGIIKRQRDKALSLYGLPGVQTDTLVFRGIHGDIVHNKVLSYALKNVIAAMNKSGCETEYFSIHALRDTFATRYIEAGGSPQTLKTILGHSSLAMTMDLYSHVLPNTKAEEMNRIAII